jgi:hypothetical protein
MENGEWLLSSLAKVWLCPDLNFNRKALVAIMVLPESEPSQGLAENPPGRQHSFFENERRNEWRMNLGHFFPVSKGTNGEIWD